MSDPTTTARETAEREGEAHIAESAVIVLDAGTPSTTELPSIELIRNSCSTPFAASLNNCFNYKSTKSHISNLPQRPE